MELELRNINHKYGDFTALRDVNITFTPGVYALLGPNGAGKSTMMNLITEIISPTEGEILLDGSPIKKLGKEYRKKLSYMPQQQGLYERFTASRFLDYIAALKGISSKNARAEIKRVLELVNLSEKKDVYIGELSGGMKQRLLIAQAMLDDPEIIILDEPTAGLDPKERIRIRNIISQISVEKIVIFATHVVSDIESLAKKVVFLKRGQIVREIKGPRELCSEIEGRVFEIKIKEDDLADIRKISLISNISESRDFLEIRAIFKDKSTIDSTNREMKKVFPNLEDLYLYLFEND